MNIASRMEKAGVPDRINVSEDTAEEVSDFFTCEYRGIQEIKNIGPKGVCTSSTDLTRVFRG